MRPHFPRSKSLTMATLFATNNRLPKRPRGQHMSSDSLSRRDLSCFPGKRGPNWHSNLASANFDRAAGNRPRLEEQKASPRQASAPFRAKQTQTNPLRLSCLLSVGYIKNGQNKPIVVNCHDFNCLVAKNARFLRFLNETPVNNRLPGKTTKTNPNKPIEVILLVFMRISQKSTKQTHGVYLKRFQCLTTIFRAVFAVFGCACVQPASGQVRILMTEN
jgi:hypothetical protein